MTEQEREELIEKMGKAFVNSLMFDDGIRAALAVAEPVIREQAENALREENARLLAALKPFGEALKDNYYHQIDALPIVAGSNQMDIRFKWTLGDLRAAAAALKETGDE